MNFERRREDAPKTKTVADYDREIERLEALLPTIEQNYGSRPPAEPELLETVLRDPEAQAAFAASHQAKQLQAESTTAEIEVVHQEIARLKREKEVLLSIENIN